MTGSRSSAATRPHCAGQLRRPLALALALAGAVLLLNWLPGCSEDPQTPPEQNARLPAKLENPAKLASEARSEATPSEGGQAGSARRYPARLETVLQKRFLRVVTSRSSLDYSLVQGRASGFQQAMVEAFVSHLNDRYPGELPIRFQFLPVHSDQMIAMLRDGRADMIAARLTITPDRSRELLFSVPYRSVDEVIVAGPGLSPPKSNEELIGHTIVVRAGSSHHESLAEISRSLSEAGQPGLEIVVAHEELESEELLVLVAEGQFDLTVSDSLLLELADALSPPLPLAPGLAIRQGGQLAWATGPAAQQLKREMDAFLPSWKKGTLLGNMAAKRYFEQFASFRDTRDTRSDSETAPLSPYDALLRRYGARYELDWHLLAAIAYQESRFRADAVNRSGAVGLFQIKPSTAAEPYVDIGPVDGSANVENNIHAAAKYLSWIKQRYFDGKSEMREKDRLRFMLAAYNAGPRSVQLAIKRAPERQLDPNRWFRNVELAMLSLRGPEPVKYVSEITKRFLTYQYLALP